jgi:hypothetical protein
VWRRPPDPSPDRELLVDLAKIVMRVDVKVDGILEVLGEENGEEEMDA